jgi:hypothetical protein
MFENNIEQSRGEFLKNILRISVFSGLVGIGLIATKKKDGISTSTELCSQQRCGKCSLVASCRLPAASLFKKSPEKTEQKYSAKPESQNEEH